MQNILNVYDSALQLLKNLTPEETYSTIIKEGMRLSGALYGSVFVEVNGELKRVYSTVPNLYQIEPRKNGYTYDCFVHKKTLVVPIKKILAAHPEATDNPAKQMILIPLSFEDDELGVLSLDSGDDQDIPPLILSELKLFGSLASLKIGNNFLIQELENSIATRDLFISMASHELKTPLTTLSAYAQLIERSIVENKPVKPEWAATLRVAALRMSRLVNELLHINQIRTGKMIYNFSEITLYEIITQGINDFTISNPRQAIELHDQRKGEVIKVWGDRDKLVQVIINLLNNAAKFSPSDKSIVISIGVKGKKGIFSVKDQGKGIAEADLAHLFEEFYKAQGNSKEGLGLGLFISKKIIEAHKGKIEIQSKLGVGTEVIIALPRIND